MSSSQQQRWLPRPEQQQHPFEGKSAVAAPVRAPPSATARAPSARRPRPPSRLCSTSTSAVPPPPRLRSRIRLLRPLPCSATSVRPRVSCGRPSIHQSVCCPPFAQVAGPPGWSCSTGRGGFAWRSSCWPSICCSHEPLPSGDIFPPLLVSSLPISHILCCSFVLLIWERTEEGIICHLCYCFALMWPLISVAVVQASCFLVLPLMVVRLQYAPISCLGCAVIFK